ncbi:MAG TPA: DUF6152 family protein [Bryobacteraceae bacterium]|nr:DUF6152 family protein [Bryobacteraceae bacterium]
MRASLSSLLSAGLMILTMHWPVFGHHSFAAEYDSAKTVTLSGAVSKMEWMNPHAQLFLDVSDQNGNRVLWEFELASPNALLRGGWSRNSVKPGDTVTVSGFRARDGSRRVKAEAVTLSDGRKVTTPSSRR